MQSIQKYFVLFFSQQSGITDNWMCFWASHTVLRYTTLLFSGDRVHFFCLWLYFLLISFYTQIALVFIKYMIYYMSIQGKYDKIPRGRTANGIFISFFFRVSKKCFWNILERNKCCLLMVISSCVMNFFTFW